MTGDTLICWCIAAVTLLYALISSLMLLRIHRTTATTTGTIVSIIRLPNPNANTHLNAHWAQVAYTVNGHTIISENRLQVPKTALISSSITIRYDTKNPMQLRQISPKRTLIALGITLLVTFIALQH
ncbi:MAG: hypothetical protein UDB11_02690 [Peptococcaceae bacterium]|nr:hypothetical protein [Peptococcaceae bacterium]